MTSLRRQQQQRRPKKSADSAEEQDLCGRDEIVEKWPPTVFKQITHPLSIMVMFLLSYKSNMIISLFLL